MIKETMLKILIDLILSIVSLIIFILAFYF